MCLKFKDADEAIQFFNADNNFRHSFIETNTEVREDYVDRDYELKMLKEVFDEAFKYVNRKAVAICDSLLFYKLFTKSITSVASFSFSISLNTLIKGSVPLNLTYPTAICKVYFDTIQITNFLIL